MKTFLEVGRDLAAAVVVCGGIVALMTLVA
jgi:hypothetical protein